jgi:hypothetical protein
MGKKEIKKMRKEAEEFNKILEERHEKESQDKLRTKLRELYDKIKEVLESYLDLKEEYYSLLALWIIGTYAHNEFDSFPYIYCNAMRGSGKTRTLRLVCKLSKEGVLMASPTEAVLFRTNGTLGIDEFERVANKDKGALRELLNAAYKKGVKIFRMRKQSEKQVVEEFEPYRPIIMANIWGMEEVLEDRCITIILEKSDDPAKTRLIEDFNTNSTIKYILENINSCSLCNVVSKKKIYSMWNNYIFDRYNTTHNTYYTYNTNTTETTLKQIEFDRLFNKIHDSGVTGRHLELFSPIFFVANIIGEDVFEKSIEIATEITKEKKHEQEIESIDVMVIDFVSNQAEGFEYHSVKDLTVHFREFADENAEWLNSRWFGRALKRLNLIVDKRRKGYGVEVMLNVKKAKEKIKMFK